VPIERLRALNEDLLRLPDGFTPHRKLERARQRRRRALDDPGERTIDWATAEEIAFASILEDGTAIRLTGQDVERGTFSQRHAVFHDVETGGTHTPLQGLRLARAAFEVRNSPLTENAVIGFEYGYSVQAPERMVIWEAQYGDFINGAQVMADEFVTSARAKWGQRSSLVLLLPHGQEGQGPDHATARPERFLQLAADINLRMVNCTTAAQYFHVLRRHAALLLTDPLPLVVLTPKSLLRHPLVASTPRELAEGHWQMVIDDEGARDRTHAVGRLLLCSGKIYVDLALSDDFGRDPGIAVCRVEQLYPFPMRELRQVVDRYPSLDEVVWIQEEPENMGAWSFARPLLETLLVESAEAAGRRVIPLRYVGRPPYASPAEGSAARHVRNQQAIVRQALSRTGRETPEREGAGAARR
jgi:2-oxoglutarate dehydrogenase E1 component